MSGRAKRDTYAPILGFFPLTSTGKVKPMKPQGSRHNPQGVPRSRRNILYRAEAHRAKSKCSKYLKSSLSHTLLASREPFLSHTP